MWKHLVREINGDQTVRFPFTAKGRTIEVEAIADPMSLGPEKLEQVLLRGLGWRQVVTPRSGFSVFSLFLGKSDQKRLLQAWYEATGLDARRLGALLVALENIEDVEVDFLRVYGVDVRDWFAGGLSSRRVANLVADLQDRPETILGADAHEIVSPLSKGEVMIAQSVAANSEAKRPHVFFKTHAQRDSEIDLQKKRERMKARGLSA